MTKKCTREESCPAVTSLVQLSGRWCKGLQHVYFTDLKTEKRRYGGVIYRESAKDEGTLLNFCPWCGEKIQYWKDK